MEGGFEPGERGAGGKYQLGIADLQSREQQRAGNPHRAENNERAPACCAVLQGNDDNERGLQGDEEVERLLPLPGVVGEPRGGVRQQRRPAIALNCGTPSTGDGPG